MNVVSRDTVLSTVRNRYQELEPLSDPGSQAARGVVGQEWNQLAAVQGNDTLEMHAWLDRQVADSRSGRNQALAVAGLGVAGGVGAGVILANTIGGAFYGGLGGATVCAFALFAAWASNYNVGHYEEARDILQRWTDVSQAPPARPPDDWLSGLILGRGPHQRTEVESLMQASRNFLGASLSEPGYPAALLVVEKDMAGLAGRSGASMEEIQAGIAAEREKVTRPMRLAGYGALAGMVLGMGSMFVGIPPHLGVLPGMAAACVLTGVGHLFLRRDRDLAALAQNLRGWEQQVQHLKDLTAEVQSLANPESSGGIGKGKGFLMIGGVRVPVGKT